MAKKSPKRKAVRSRARATKSLASPRLTGLSRAHRIAVGLFILKTLKLTCGKTMLDTAK
jgi:hypothetical protein